MIEAIVVVQMFFFAASVLSTCVKAIARNEPVIILRLSAGGRHKVMDYANKLAHCYNPNTILKQQKKTSMLQQ